MGIKLIINSLIEHELDQSLITFGRSKSCHIEFDHPGVSRRHFIIKFVDGEYIIVDEGSRHGTVIDGQMLDAHQPMIIDAEHLIELPGFSIQLFCDGQEPKLERTTVVTRKLLDELLQDAALPRECPTLQTDDGNYYFTFVEDKTSFVLGKLSQVDFVVKENDVANEHLSFVRDINGIRLNPLPGHEVFINGIAVNEPHILEQGDLIKVGPVAFVFKKTADKHSETPSTSVEEQSTNNQAVDRELSVNECIEKTINIKSRLPLLGILDQVFLWVFFLVVAGISVMFFELV